ncbi:MAG: hypothetical protein KAX38_07020 [Candidatus Krumholzibacteria bacterium]|nr:hypothetical protein [Candidatus Krumholzibacteria bacterium]
MSYNKHHNVYVIELDKAVLREPKFAEANAGCDPEKACFYVGLTGLIPGERFEKHRTGYKSNKYVRKYGRRLCPRLYEEYNPMFYEDAQEMEVELARMLREKGHAVWQK